MIGSAATQRRPWRETIRAYGDRRVAGMLLLGFSAGLPYPLVFSSMSRWLSEEGITASAIGLFSLTGLAYGLKFIWAPLVDNLRLPGLHGWLGRRRSWLFLAQMGVAAGLVGMAFTNPKTDLWTMALFAVIVGFSGATQDIAIDAWRIETAPDEHMLGVMAGAYQLGYRIALLVAGAGLFVLVEGLQATAPAWAWTIGYVAMVAFMLLSLGSTLWVREPVPRDRALAAPTPALASRTGRIGVWFANAFVNPFVEFFTRNRWAGIVILLFIACFWLSDRVWGVMAQPFYNHLGFDKVEIALISKTFGLWMSVGGVLVGSLIVARYGIAGPLLASAALTALTNLLFAALALHGKSEILLTLVISAENVAGGIAGTALIAYLSSLTNTAYTATQYALFTSLMALPGKLVAGFSGFVVEALGYPLFFVYTALMGVPAVILILVLMRWGPTSASARKLAEREESADGAHATQPAARAGE